MLQSATRLSSPLEVLEGIPFASSLDKPLPLRQLLTYPVFITVVNFAYLTFLTSSHSSLLPLFFAMPIEIGGLGFDPRRIGYIMGAYRAITAVFMATSFSNIVRYLGERRTHVLAMATSQVCWVLFPVVNLCARHYGISLSVWTGIVLWIVPTTSSDMAFCSFRFVLPSSSRSWRINDVISTSRLYLCIPHCSGTKQVFPWSNSWPFADGCFDSIHDGPLVVDISVFPLCGTESSWRLCRIRRFLVPIVLRSVGCDEIA